LAAADPGVTPTAIRQQIRLPQDRFGKQLFLHRPNGGDRTDAAIPDRMASACR
jgi:hypothetical protein